MAGIACRKPEEMMKSQIIYVGLELKKENLQQKMQIKQLKTEHLSRI